jgi:hypothetical protein
MHLIERYSLACGAKINKPEMLNHFFPISWEKYICVSSSKQEDPKNYSFWDIVFGICSSAFEKNNIKIVQVGDQNDTKIPSNLDLRGKTNSRQNAFILKNAKIFVGVDGFHSHLSSFYGTPSVSLYPFSFVECSKPYWGPSFPISAEREDILPPFSHTENPRSVDQIKPEIVAAKILEALEIKGEITFKTIYAGVRCKDECIDIIPKKNSLVRDPRINIRMDKFFSEKNLYSILSRNACEVTTDKSFSLDNPFAVNISTVNYVCNTFDIEFIAKLKKLAIKTNLLCSSKENLAQERKKLFDYQIHYFNLDEQTKERKAKAQHNTSELKIFTKKKVLCGDEFYGTLFEYTKDENDFFLDLDWFYCYQ